MTAELHPFSHDEVMAYLDGEVIGDRALALADHIEGCATCSALASEFCLLSQQMGEWKVETSSAEPPPDHYETAALHEAGLSKSWFLTAAFHRRWILGLGGAFAVVLILTSTLSFRPGRRAAPSIGPAPSSGLNVDGQWPRSNAVTVEGAGAVDHSDNAIRKGIDSSHVNGRNYTDFTLLDSHANRDSSPAIRKTVSLSLTVKDIEAARAALEDIAKRHHGYFAELDSEGQSEDGKSLTASLRVPLARVDSTVVELRKLGQVLEEKQTGEDLTHQLRDLGARLANSRRTEKRLTDLLVRRGDKLKDVLDVERELASTREEIERMEAEDRNMTNLVEFAAIELSLREDYKPALGLVPPAAGKRLRNASVEGYGRATESGMNALVSALHYGPTVLLWVMVLLFPAQRIWRRIRSIQVQTVAGTV